jgi:DNA uptake protein ComE-like DNA-binding protein
VSKISINTATEIELMSLTGVGEVRAKAIVDNRPYAALDDLITKKVLTEKIVSDNEGKLAL